MPGFLPKLGRSLIGLIVIGGGAFATTVAARSGADGSRRSWALRVPVIVGLIVLNMNVTFAASHVFTPREADNGRRLPAPAGQADRGRNRAEPRPAPQALAERATDCAADSGGRSEAPRPCTRAAATPRRARRSWRRVAVTSLGRGRCAAGGDHAEPELVTAGTPPRSVRVGRPS
jgi:hypothetical protein